MKRSNDVLMYLLIGLASLITVAAFFQQSADQTLILAASGFTLFTFGWTGMYFRLKRELPEHALIDAEYLNLGSAWTGQRRSGFRNMLGLIQLHFQRNRVDLSSTLLIAGAAMLAASLIGSVV